MAAHLGFVNGAVQCIVLLVILQTEVQGPQCSCKDREGEHREKEKEISGTPKGSLGREETKMCLPAFIVWKKSPDGKSQGVLGSDML